MKQKKEEIQFQPINKLTKSIYGTKVAINLDEQKLHNLDEEKLQSVKEGEYIIENLQAGSDKSEGDQPIKEQLMQDENRYSFYI